MNIPSSRIPAIDGLKGIAIIAILFGHIMLMIPEMDSMILRVLAYLGVLMFFALSGYCLMLSALRDADNFSVRRFLLRRAERLLVPYYGGMFLSLLAILFLLHFPSGTVWDSALPVTGWNFFTHLILIQNFTDSALSINPVYWFVATEAQLSLLFPLFFLLFRRRGISETFLAGFLMAIVLYVVTNGGTYFARPEYILVFVFGMSAALSGLIHRIPFVLNAALGSRLLTRFGFLSYSIYLVHMPVLLLIHDLLPSDMSSVRQFLVLVLIGIPLTAMFAEGFSRLFERNVRS